MKILFVISFLINTFSLFSNNIEKVIVVNHNTTPINLDKHTYIYSTNDTSSDVNNILNKEFIYNAKGLNVGINNKIRWEKFSLNNPTNISKKYYIYFPYNHINKIIAYVFHNDSLQKTTHTGT